VIRIDLMNNLSIGLSIYPIHPLSKAKTGKLLSFLRYHDVLNRALGIEMLSGTMRQPLGPDSNALDRS
jgi:hypothetical protein